MQREIWQNDRNWEDFHEKLKNFSSKYFVSCFLSWTKSLLNLAKMKSLMWARWLPWLTYLQVHVSFQKLWSAIHVLINLTMRHVARQQPNVKQEKYASQKRLILRWGLLTTEWVNWFNSSRIWNNWSSCRTFQACEKKDSCNAALRLSNRIYCRISGIHCYSHCCSFDLCNHGRSGTTNSLTLLASFLSIFFLVLNWRWLLLNSYALVHEFFVHVKPKAKDLGKTFVYLHHFFPRYYMWDRLFRCNLESCKRSTCIWMFKEFSMVEIRRGCLARNIRE